MKEDQKTTAQAENSRANGTPTPAHLSFRRIAVHEFTAEQAPEQIRFYYRSHRKHNPAALAA